MSGLSKITILFLAANPQDTSELRLGKESREIDERLQATKFRDRFDLKQHWATRYSDLSEALERHQPHIVHFSGHGSAQGGITVESENGEAHPVRAQPLAELFRLLKGTIRCVVLNACRTAEQAEVIAQEIDCVVGMSGAIGDDAAIIFARGFYQALGNGHNVQEAFDLGCVEIELANIPEDARPKLLTRPGIEAADITFVEPWNVYLEEVPPTGNQIIQKLNEGEVLMLTGGRVRYGDFYCGYERNQICVVIVQATREQNVTIDDLEPRQSWLGITNMLSAEEALSSQLSRFWRPPNCGSGCSKATIRFFEDNRLVDTRTIQSPR